MTKSIHTEGNTLPLNCFGFCPRVFHHKHSEAKLSKAEWLKNALSYVNIALDHHHHHYVRPLVAGGLKSLVGRAVQSCCVVHIVSVYLRFMSPRVNSGFSLFRPIFITLHFLLQILHGIFQLLHLLCLAFAGVHWVSMRSGARHPSIVGILFFHLGPLCRFLCFPWLSLYWFRLSRVRIVGLIALPLGVCCLFFYFPCVAVSGAQLCS